MMYSKKEKQMLPLIAAALLLGVFSLNPMAQAAELGAEAFAPPSASAPKLVRTEVIRVESVQADRRPAADPVQPEPIQKEERDGMTLQELNQVLREPLQVRTNEQKTNIAFLGDVPARCVYDKQGQMTASIDYDTETSSKEGKHVFRVHMPLCERDPNFKKIPGEKMVKLSSIPGARAINDVKGPVVLASGYKDSEIDPKLEPLKGRDGKEVELQSDAVVAAAEAQQKAAEQAADRLKQLEASKQKQDEEAQRQAKREQVRIEKIAKNFEDTCKAGDIDGMDHAIGNLPELREDFSGIVRRRLGKDLESATNAEDAKMAWEAIQESSDKFEWDEEVLKKAQSAYIKKRFQLINDEITAISSGDSSASSLDGHLADWADELARLDSKEFKKSKGEFAKAYGFLAANSSDIGKKKSNREVAKAVAEAERYYGKSKKFADADDKNRAEGAMAKLNGEAYKACVRLNPMNPASCDSTYREGVKAHGENYVGALAKKAENGDEEARNDVANFARDYLQAEGFGASMNYGQFGTIHQMPGYFEQFKMQTMQQAQVQMQQQMMQQYQQQMMSQMFGGMGMGMNMGMGFGMNMGMGGGLMGGRTGFFGF